MLAGEGVPPAAGDADQEDRYVASGHGSRGPNLVEIAPGLRGALFVGHRRRSGDASRAGPGCRRRPAGRRGRAATPAASTAEPDEEKAIELVYIPDNAAGVVAFRPAATFRRPGMEKLAEMLEAAIATRLRPDSRRSDGESTPRSRAFRGSGPADIEWVACGVTFGRDGKEGSKLHTSHDLRVHGPDDPPVRLAEDAPRVGDQDDRGPRRRGRVPQVHRCRPSGRDPAGRTAPTTGRSSWTARCEIRSLIHRGGRSVPAFVQNADWQRASRGLLAVAINNQRRDIREGLRPGPAG